MASSSNEIEYENFLKKVRRTVFIDNLSPHVTNSILKTALDQFGQVKSVHFIPNYLGPANIPKNALVEMEDPDKVEAVITTLTQLPFMISGMPRPVRARAAEPEMFDDRPAKPGRRIRYTWLDQNDPDFEMAKTLKLAVQKHSADTAFVIKRQMLQEEELANQQSETLKGTEKKLSMIESIMTDKSAHRLARYYNSNILDE